MKIEGVTQGNLTEKVGYDFCLKGQKIFFSS